MSFELNKIGTVISDEMGFRIAVDKDYRAGLKGLEGFNYIQLLWWFDKCDDARSRSTTTVSRPYKCGPEELGVFATRSPMRPNPIAVSTSYVTYIDIENGVIGLAWIDALNGTPVLDIKPYTPSIDRVEQPEVPSWCQSWPKNVESSGDFNWEDVFNF